VLVEVRVLRSEHRELHVWRQVVELHDRAALGEELGDHGAVSGEDARHLRRSVAAAELGCARQACFDAADEDREADRSDGGEERGGEEASAEPAEDQAAAT
jgi:hypothetical protein